MTAPDATEHWIEACTTLDQEGGRDDRAPHKPLLLLLLLADVQRGGAGALHFSQVEVPLRALLDDYGRPVRSGRQQPELPIWHLGSAPSIYVLTGVEGLEFRRAPGKRRPLPTLTSLRRVDPVGGLAPALLAHLRRSPEAIPALALRILAAQFPDTLHHEITAAVGLDLGPVVGLTARRVRDPAFRKAVLLAYEYRCAVCAFQLRLAERPVALEAAHIHWHTANGPDEVANGLCLCSLHHSLFDRGAFTLDEDACIRVSRLFNGAGSEEALGRYAGHRVAPRTGEAAPAVERVRWHAREVFREYVA